MVQAVAAISRVWRGTLTVLLLPLPSLALVFAAVGLNLPWPLTGEVRATLPFLALPIVHWSAFRVPALLPAPIVLAAGIIADTVADTPLGYWPIVMLSVLASGRLSRHFFGTDAGPMVEWLALPVHAAVAFAPAMLVPFLFTLVWPSPAPILAGLGLGIAIETALIMVMLLVRMVPRGRRAVVRTSVH